MNKAATTIITGILCTILSASITWGVSMASIARIVIETQGRVQNDESAIARLEQADRDIRSETNARVLAVTTLIQKQIDIEQQYLAWLHMKYDGKAMSPE